MVGNSKKEKYKKVDVCVVCGRYAPEGTMLCSECSKWAIRIECEKIYESCIELSKK